jgi:hypothetical protein
MILRFSPQTDSPHSQIFRKAGKKKAEPNRPDMMTLTLVVGGQTSQWMVMFT